MRKDLAERTADGRLRLHFHPGQMRAWRSEKRFVLVLAGTQGGKTAFGPHWLHREMTRRGPGDYLVASPTYRLMHLKVLPEIRLLFERHLRAGKLTGDNSPEFKFSPAGEQRVFGRRGEQPSRIIFGHAADPDSLESATAKAAWLDEAGQRKFVVSSFEAVLRRLAVHQGRLLVTTTPYYLGWLKTKLYDPWKAAGEDHPLIDVVRFRSTMNPAFPASEYEQARDTLPGWKFRMFYDGHFEKPAGLVYDCFDARYAPEGHLVRRFRLPADWPRYLGLDFGQVNTAAVFYAEDPAGRLYAYREYHAGGRSAAEHAAALLAGEPGLPLASGGSKSEGLWRDDFAAAGLPVHEPACHELEVGIDRVYAAHKAGRVLVFDDLVRYLDQLASYSRKVDDAGNVLAEIEDKHSYHLLDASRYILSSVFAPAGHNQAAGRRVLA